MESGLLLERVGEEIGPIDGNRLFQFMDHAEEDVVGAMVGLLVGCGSAQ